MMNSDRKYLVRIIGAGFPDAVEVKGKGEPTAESVIKAVEEQLERIKH